MNPTFIQARALASQGIASIPVDSNKIPSGGSWKKYQTQTPSDEELVDLFRTSDRLAIVAGEVQCIDIDCKYRKGLWESYESRCEEFELGEVLKKPILQQTMNGGYHLVFRCKDLIANMSGIAKTANANPKDQKGLFDFRGSGGYFLTVPSPGYTILRGSLDSIPELSPDERDDLLAVARSFDESQPVQVREPVQRDARQGGSPGDAFDAVADIELPLLLSRNGWTRCGDRYWRRPGKRRGVSATWGNVQIEGTPRFWVFSSSTIFQTDHAYKPWHVYAVLEHAGDFESAARELARRGYGETRKQEKPKSATLTEIQPASFDVDEEKPVEKSAREIAMSMANKAASELEEESPKFSLPKILTIDEELDEKWPTPPEVIKGVLYQGAKMMLAGPSKARKTFALTDLALSVGAGLPWLGFPTQQMPVLYLNFELQNFASRHRTNAIRKAKFEGKHADSLVYFWHLRGQLAKRGIPPQVVYAQIVDKVRDFAFEFDIGLIVIDPVYRLMQLAGEENKAEDVGRMLNELEAIAQETGAAVAFCHHFAKGNAASKDSMDRASGSGVFARDPDALLTMTPHEEEECMIVEGNLRNFRAPDPIGIRWNYPMWERDVSIDPEAFKQATKATPSGPGRKKAASIDDLRKLLPRFGGSVKRENTKAISEALGCSEKTVWNRWKEIQEEDGQ